MVDFNIQPVDLSAVQAKPNRNASKPENTNSATFGQWLERSINTVDRMKKEADAAAQKLAAGENKDIHGTMISMQKADIAMNLMMEVRNKIISAYDEIKRMQF